MVTDNNNLPMYQIDRVSDVRSMAREEVPLAAGAH